MSRNYLLVSFDKFDLALCLHLFIAAAFVPAYRLLGCSIVVKELYGFVIAKFWTLCYIFVALFQDFNKSCCIFYNIVTRISFFQVNIKYVIFLKTK